MNFADVMTTEMSHTKTWNGADALSTTGSRCLDFFGRIGAMRNGDKFEKLDLFDAAYAENPDAAMKLLFYARDIRSGYGERDAFNEIFAHLAKTHKESVKKNLANVIEYGRAKDLYSLIGTPAAISERVEPQIEPCEVEPFEERTSETTRIAYGNSSTLGRTGISAFSASAPWPISLLPGPLDGFVSPTL